MDTSKQADTKLVDSTLSYQNVGIIQAIVLIQSVQFFKSLYSFDGFIENKFINKIGRPIH